MDLVSIIVPVYNNEKYLNKCIDSLVNQTYTNIEIILIDDGCTDNCPAICEEYANADERVNCMHIDNGGVSNARNTGLLRATGEYILFIDSDDYYEIDTVETMVDKIKQGVSMVSAKYSIVVEGIKDIEIGLNKNAIVDCEDYLQYAFPTDIGFYFGTTANKIYNAAIIRENNVYFEKNITLCEDLLFNLEYLKYVDKVYILDKNIYFYEQSNCCSLIKKRRPRGEVWQCKSSIFKAYVDTFTVRGVYDNHKVNIANYLIGNAVQELKEIIEYDGDKQHKILVNIVKEFCSIDYVYEAAKITKDKNKLVNVTAKNIRKKKYGSLIITYRVKRFMKNKMKTIHDYLKKSNEI